MMIMLQKTMWRGQFGAENLLSMKMGYMGERMTSEGREEVGGN